MVFNYPILKAIFNKDFKAEIITYEPKDFITTEVDTTMSNGYKVNIKTYTDLENSVDYSDVKDSINYITRYRNYKFNIKVERYGQLIYEETFDKAKANKTLGYNPNFSPDSPFYDFDKLAVLKSIEIDDEPSIKDSVMINVIYAIPNTNRLANHTIFINQDGTTNAVHVKIN